MVMVFDGLANNAVSDFSLVVSSYWIDDGRNVCFQTELSPEVKIHCIHTVAIPFQFHDDSPPPCCCSCRLQLLPLGELTFFNRYGPCTLDIHQSNLSESVGAQIVTEPDETQ